MPILACCTKGQSYAKSALLDSKAHLYANDVSIKSPHVYHLPHSFLRENFMPSLLIPIITFNA